MQHPATLSRDELARFATSTYFGAVDAKDMDATLACFDDAAIFTVQTSFTTHAGKPAIRAMFETFFAGYETIVHRDFDVTVDARNGRVAASFTADLIGHDGARTLLHNTNFWRFRDGRFQEVHVYMSGANVLV